MGKGKKKNKHLTHHNPSSAPKEEDQNKRSDMGNKGWSSDYSTSTYGGRGRGMGNRSESDYSPGGNRAFQMGSRSESAPVGQMPKTADPWQNPHARQFLEMSRDERRKKYKIRSQYRTIDEIPSFFAFDKVYGRRTREDKGYKVNVNLANKVSLWQGDITTLEIDAIVNAANSSLMGGGGVDGAIHRAAGSTLLSECRLLDRCPTGFTKLSGGHCLPARYILHTVGPQGQNKAALAKCYKSCLQIARERNFRTVAFCCISTGIYGYPNEPAAHVALETVRLHLEKYGDEIDRIIFCTFLNTDFEIYKRLMSTRYFPCRDGQHSGQQQNANKQSSHSQAPPERNRASDKRKSSTESSPASTKDISAPSKETESPNKDAQPTNKDTNPPKKETEPVDKETESSNKETKPSVKETPSKETPTKETKSLSEETQPSGEQPPPSSEEPQPPSEEPQPLSEEHQPPSEEPQETQPPKTETQPSSEETQSSTKETQASDDKTSISNDTDEVEIKELDNVEKEGATKGAAIKEVKPKTSNNESKDNDSQSKDNVEAEKSKQNATKETNSNSSASGIPGKCAVETDDVATKVPVETSDTRPKPESELPKIDGKTATESNDCTVNSDGSSPETGQATHQSSGGPLDTEQKGDGGPQKPTDGITPK